MHSIIKDLDKRRRILGLTQRQLAEKAGITEATYSNILNGANAHLRTIEKIGEALNQCEGYEIRHPDQIGE